MRDQPGGPVFIVGSMGSGTTLLRLILDSHPHLAIAQETTFMRAYLAHKWIPFWISGGEWYGRIGMSEQELDDELRAFYGSLFERFAQRHGKQRWGDKSPHHMWHLRELAALFPDAIFIATVRHPGAVASSQHYRFRWLWSHAVSHWHRNYMELVHRAADIGDRLAIVRYEDLVSDQEQTLRELLDWMGEPWDQRVVEHHVVHSERGTPTKVEGKTRSTDPVDAQRVSKWVQTMDDEGWTALRKTGPLARFYGYDLDDAGSFQSLVPSDSSRKRIITGTELHARKADFGDVNWSFRPTPSLANQMLKSQTMTVVRKTRKRRVPRSELNAKLQAAGDSGRSKTGASVSGPQRKGGAAKRRQAAVVQQPSAKSRVARAVWRRLPKTTRRKIRTFVRNA